MTRDILRNAETQYKRASRRAEDMRGYRNKMIAQALVEGWTHARIAEATGMTRGRVGQIALAAKKGA